MRKLRLYRGWFMPAVVWVLNLLCVVPAIYAFGVVAQSMAAELGLSMTVAAGAYTAHTAVHGALSPLHGRFVSRYGARRSATAGLAAGAAAFGALGLIRGSTILYYALFIVPMSIFMRFSGSFLCQMIVAKWFFRHRGLAMGLFFASGGLGGYLFTTLFERMMALWGWRSIWLYLAGACLLCLIAVLACLKEAPCQEDEQTRREFMPAEPKHGRKGQTRSRESWTCREALACPGFYLVLLIFILSQYTMYAVCNTGLSYLSEVGVERARAARMVSMFSLVSVAGRLLAGWFSDRMIAKWGLAGGCMLYLTGMAALYAAPLSAWLQPGMLMLGVGYGMVMVAPSNLLLDFFGAREYAQIVSWYSLFSSVISALFPVLFGAMYDLTGGYAPVWIAGAALSVLCAAASLLASAPQKRSWH